jgi:acyl dehydratase
VIEKRESRSRPGWGLIRFRNTGVNQHGAEVLTIVGSVYIEKRSAEIAG